VKKYLVVNAEDLGMSVATNLAIARAFRQGLLTSASLMANMPAMLHAVRHVVRENPRLGIGVHLCLTSGLPVLPPSHVPLLVDGRGRFRHGFLGILRLLHSPRRSEALEQIYQELSAQVARTDARGVVIDHLDSHHHVHMIPEIFKLAAGLARQHRAAIRIADETIGWTRPRAAAWIPCLLSGGLPKKLLLSGFARAVRRLDTGVLSADHYAGILHSGRMTRPTLGRILERLATGITEVGVHPGQVAAGDDSPAGALCCSRQDGRWLRSPYRAAELAALVDRSLCEHLLQLDITLVRFSDVLPRLAAGRAGSLHAAAA
jgi:chitin disaccharide deacetylase